MSTPTPTPACVRTVAGLRRRLDEARAARLRIGLVPTMGALHAGHRSLVRLARARDDFVAVSVFVNPLQFGPSEDYDDYPRDLSGDLQACADEGADLVFAPERTEMYPEPPVTVVSVGPLARVLCGASRPGHFDGVATVVAKLFAVAGECSAYFGEKDFQQLSVVRRVVADLSLQVTVVGCPTVREPDGLALSSRNAYLSPAERAQAPVMLRALEAGADRVRLGEADPDAVSAVIGSVIATAPLAELEYAAAVPERDLTGAGPLTGRVRLLAAARFGRARLIDNVGCAVGSARQAV